MNERRLNVYGRVSAAWRGERGANQRRIAEKALEFIDLLLRKNADYGCSAWKRPVLAPHMDVGDAIFARMSDKVERIAQLSSREGEVAESLDDTVRDLGAYCLLWLCRPREGTGETSEPEAEEAGGVCEGVAPEPGAESRAMRDLHNSLEAIGRRHGESLDAPDPGPPLPPAIQRDPRRLLEPPKNWTYGVGSATAAMCP